VLKHVLAAEKFEQAITDYSAGLALKTDLLPLSSRQLAEAHYKLSIALDLTAGRLADAIHHAQRALESIEARLDELRPGLAGTLSPPQPPPTDSSDAKGKGKGKPLLAPDELVQNWSKAQIEAEIKELSELKQDLALKARPAPTTCIVLKLTNERHNAAGRRVKGCAERRARCGFVGAGIGATCAGP
jgi:HAT1-interacting factor 1